MPTTEKKDTTEIERTAFSDRIEVSVVIPHFYASRKEGVRELMDGLRAQTFRDMEVLVVHAISPQGKAINHGVRQAQGRFLVVMDDDTSLDQPELVENLLRTLESDPRIAMAGASLISPRDINGFQRAAAKQFPRFNMPIVDKATDSDMACHGCVAFRRDVFERVGMEREDLVRGLDPDLRVRIRNAGYRVVLAPRTWVYHPFPVSLPKFLRLFYRNGDGASHTQVFHPEISYDTAEALDATTFVPKRSFLYRLLRFPVRLLHSLLTLQWIRFMGYAAYFFGYLAGCIRYSARKFQTAIPGIAIGLIASLMLAACVFYWKAGHPLIRDIYEGRSVPFLNALIQGQAMFPLSMYLEIGDGFLLTTLAAGFLLILAIGLVHFKKPFTEGDGWILGSLICLLTVVVMYGRPFLGENELVYLIHPKKLLHPEFLRHDWNWSQGGSGHLFFELLVSPLMIFMNPLQTALVGRFVVWGLLIYVMAQAGRAMRLSWGAFAAGFAFWLFAEQSLAAGEWIFHGLEAKCVSYVFLFAALFFLLKERLTAAAISSGLSISFHPLVGGWAALAFLLVILFTVRQTPVWHLFRFCILSFLFALPGLVPTLPYLLRGGPMTPQNYAVDVLFRGTHHMDPAAFLSADTAVKILIYLGLASFVIGRSLPREEAKKIRIFLWSAMGFFGLGLWARAVEWWQYLYLYPFRLGPLFLLLFSSWGVFHFLGRQAGPSSPYRKGFTLLLAGFLIFEAAHHEMPQKLLKGSAYFFVSWRHHLAGQDRDDFDRVSEWIQKNTPPDSVFLAPPWEYGFWLKAERAQVVSYKYLHVNASNEEWMGRIQALNGDRRFHNTGGAALRELKENFPKLSGDQLLKLKEKYGADYYLTVQPREDLPFELVFANDSYFLYRLS